jgi:hypothetical protein
MVVVRSAINLSVICAFVIGGSSLAADQWKAGVAKAKITPERPMWLSGYANRDRPAEGQQHDLWAKALALEDSAGNRAILVTLDLCGIDRILSQQVCNALQESHGLKRPQIALCVSHTHSGPVVERNLAPMYFLDTEQQGRVREYTATLQRKIIETAGEAIKKLAPARAEWSTGQTTFAVNRRNNKEGEVKQLREQGKLRGPVDHGVPVLAVRGKNDALKAIVFGYACHATVLNGYEWSGDYPGYAQVELEKMYPSATALFVAGCGADQNALPRRKVELAASYGRQLAESVDEVLRSPMNPVEGNFAASYTEVPLPLERIPNRDDLQKELSSTDKYVAHRAKLLLAELDAGRPIADTYPYPVQTWHIGSELTWVFLGGEVVVDYSLRLKAEFNDRALRVFGYANDVMAYIPSRRVLAEGGYEGREAMVYYGLPSAWTADVEQLIVEEVHRQVAKGNNH